MASKRKGHITDFFIQKSSKKACNQNDEHVEQKNPSPSHPTLTEDCRSHEPPHPTDETSSGPSIEKTSRPDATHFDIAKVADGTMNNADDEMKTSLIKNRQPCKTFQFPAKSFKDKRSKSGVFNRYCKHEWFEKFNFLSYSESLDGLFCVCCVLFPMRAHQGGRAKLLIKTPYRNWKDALVDLGNHSGMEYHKDSMTRMQAFLGTAKDPSIRIEHIISASAAAAVERNRRFLKSILRAIEYLGRQGLALRGDHDDGALLKDTDEEVINKGNFRALLSVMCETDEALREHLESCDKRASYISKTTQNNILDCIRDFIQETIVDEVKSQKCGPYFGIAADEVTDSANWEQLGIVIRYVRNNKPIERLVEYVKCENIRGATIAEYIVACLEKLGLDAKYCRSQTYDGAGNMAGYQNGAAKNFQIMTGNDKAVYYHCASHELNLSLSKASKVAEVYNMVCLLQTIGRFFINSAKRQGHFEKTIKESVEDEKEYNKMKKKVKPLCETRWVERHTAFEDLEVLYEYLLNCLDSIAKNTDRMWDPKSVTESNGMCKQLMEPKFFVSFQVCRFLFGFTKMLSIQLQGTNMEISKAYDQIDLVTKEIQYIRENEVVEFRKLFAKSTAMANKAGLEETELSRPRAVGRQTLRSNIEASTPEEYWRRTIFLPFIDCLTNQLNERFKGRTYSAVQALYLLPDNLEKYSSDHEDTIKTNYEDDMPNPGSFSQEVRLWKRFWSTEKQKPNTISGTLEKVSLDELDKSFPNIMVILNILLTVPSTSASVERANSSLKYVKNVYRNRMSEPRLNALILMYVHKNIPLDYDKIIDMYARRHPRRMMFINPCGDS